MRDITTYLTETAGLPAGDESAPHLRSILQRQREQIAEALRRPETVEDILRVLRIPVIVRGLVRPYVRRALDTAAAWIHPNEPNPS